MFRLGETEDFKKIKEEQKQKAKKAAKNHRNHRNKLRRRARKAEWKANNPKPERVEDVLKAVSASRKKVK